METAAPVMKTDAGVKRLTLVDMTSSNIDVSLSAWRPGSNEDVHITLDLEIGFSDGSNAAHMFYVALATPEGLKHRRKGVLLVLNRTLVVATYDYDALTQTILDILSASTRDTWEQSCAVLQRYFHWEYEDYR